MKILHVLHSAWVGGIEKLCLDIAERCPEDGFYFVERRGVLLEKFQFVNKNIYSFSPQAHAVRKVTAWVRCILELITLHGYDAVIFHHGSPYFWMASRRIKLRRKLLKVFLYAHSDISASIKKDSTILKWRLRYMIYRRAAKKIDGIIAISKVVKERLVDVLPFMKNKIYVNYNGIDLSKFPRCTDTESGYLRLVYVGRLIKVKGVQNILRALADCRDMPVSLDIIGDGEYRNALEDLTLSLGLQDMVHFVGMQQDVAKLLPDYNFFIHLPQWEEGFGITVAEALACGLICIVNDRGAMPELIQDGYNGFVLPAGQSYDLRQLFSNILHGNYDLKIMRENAAESAQGFSINKTVEKLEDIVISSYK